MKALGLCLLSFAVGFAIGGVLGWFLYGWWHS
jgi:hypothetical protein